MIGDSPTKVRASSTSAAASPVTKAGIEKRPARSSETTAYRSSASRSVIHPTRPALTPARANTTENG
jgi:hypothetical protein